ncbi:hypothetical protein WBG99_08795 [Streptomyces sp. TG1A-60]|uniref:hypothetical protein n=1 Tax=Streptomyces sp. TG1A-60 TaxID=3129111 RepID=UPI0030D524AD
MFRIQFNRPARTVRVSATFSVALAVATAIAACSNGGREEEKKYTAPSAFCGISLEPDLLNAFLPGGDSISVKPTFPNGGTKRCDVIVDGTISVRQIQTWWSTGESASTIAAAYDKMDDGQVTADGRYLYSGAGAVGKTTASCKTSDHPDQDLYAVIQVFTPERSDSDAMKKLITAYTKGLEQSSRCN